MGQDLSISQTTADYSNIEKYWPFPEYRAGQRELLSHVKAALENPAVRFVAVEASTGCHAKGQGILLHTGEVVPVEKVSVGDFLMGPDSAPRTVLSLCRGRGRMYEIRPIKGDPFVVNEDHILSLVSVNVNPCPANRSLGKPSQIVNVPVREYLSWGSSKKHMHKLYKTGVDFAGGVSSSELKIPPYILGVWLGDGRCNGTEICKSDAEIRDSLQEYADSIDHRLHVHAKSRTRVYLRVTPRRRGYAGKNQMLNALRSYGLINNKHVPREYLTASRADRLELLAGLLDTDGHLDHSGFEIVTKYKNLSDNILFLARSLGLRATHRVKTGTIKSLGFSGQYQRIVISGHTDMIPTRVPRKKALPRGQVKDALRTGFTVLPLGVQDFYGFTLSGDHLYLLNDFTVTHNSGKSGYAVAAGRASRDAYLCTANKFLQTQYGGDFAALVADLRGRANYFCNCYGTDPQTGTLYTCSSSPCRKTKKSRDNCAKDRQCEYHAAFLAAQQSKLTLFNFAAALTFLNYTKGFSRRNLLVIDEAHNAEAWISNFMTISLPVKRLRDLNIVKEVPDFGTVGQYRAFLMEVAGIVAAMLDNDAVSALGSAEVEWLESVRNRIKSVFRFYPDSLDTFALKKEIENGRISSIQIVPVVIKDVAEKALFRFAGKVLFLSATIGGFESFRDVLGIPKEEFVGIRVGSTFPAERRPFFQTRGRIRLNRKNLQEEMPRLVQETDAILDLFPGQRGIVHGHSYSICESIIRGSKHAARFAYPRRAADQPSVLLRHAQTPGSVLLSPSLQEGVDLRDELSRFQILVKCPWPDLGDPVTARRCDLYPTYLTDKTLLKILQSYGRSVRSPDDIAATFSLDKAIFDLLWDLYTKEKYKKPEERSLPQWVLDAIELDETKLESTIQGICAASEKCAAVTEARPDVSWLVVPGGPDELDRDVLF